MRILERIPIILDRLQNSQANVCYVYNKILEHSDKIFHNKVHKDLVIAKDIVHFYSKFNQIKEYWLKNPDLRLVQVLAILEVVENNSGRWYYIEDEDLCKDFIKPREIYFWSSIYDSEGNRLDKPKVTLIKDLDTTHIKAILRDYENFKLRVNENYKEMFINELKLRSRVTMDEFLECKLDLEESEKELKNKKKWKEK